MWHPDEMEHMRRHGNLDHDLVVVDRSSMSNEAIKVAVLQKYTLPRAKATLQRQPDTLDELDEMQGRKRESPSQMCAIELCSESAQATPGSVESITQDLLDFDEWDRVDAANADWWRKGK